MSIDGRGARFNVSRLAPLLEDVHDRLAGVVIERLPWETFLTRYDRLGTLFYLDPPYFGTEDFYGKEMFPRDQFAALATALTGLKGQFLVSLNDCPEVRELFRGFKIEAVQTRYTVSGGGGAAAGEVFISP